MLGGRTILRGTRGRVPSTAIAVEAAALLAVLGATGGPAAASTLLPLGAAAAAAALPGAMVDRLLPATLRDRLTATAHPRALRGVAAGPVRVCATGVEVAVLRVAGDAVALLHTPADAEEVAPLLATLGGARVRSAQLLVTNGPGALLALRCAVRDVGPVVRRALRGCARAHVPAAPLPPGALAGALAACVAAQPLPTGQPVPTAQPLPTGPAQPVHAAQPVPTSAARPVPARAAARPAAGGPAAGTAATRDARYHRCVELRPARRRPGRPAPGRSAAAVPPAPLAPVLAALAAVAGPWVLAVGADRADGRAGHSLSLRLVGRGPGEVAAALAGLARALRPDGVRVAGPPGGRGPALAATLPLATAAGGPWAAVRPDGRVTLGTTRGGRPYRLALLRPEPTRIHLVAAPTVAAGLLRRLAGHGVPVRIGPPDTPVASGECLLAVHPPEAPDVAALASAGIVLLGRMPPASASAVAGALGLREAGGWLQRVPADLLGVYADGHLRWVRTSAAAPRAG